MTNKEMNLGLVGLGKWGKNYFNTINSRAIPNVRISSVCARTEETLASVAEGYRKTTDFRDLVGHNLDGIMIASSTITHFEIAAHYLLNGLNILIEKPVTQTYDQARQLQSLYRQHQEAVILVGHIQIYDPGYWKLKQSLNKIGKIEKMIFKGLQSPVRTDSTVVENWGPHPIYLFADIIQGIPRSISAIQATGDNVHIDISYDHQVKGSVDIGSISQEKKRELTVVGKMGSLTLDWSAPNKTLVLTTKEDITDIPFPTNSSPLELEILEFVNCISTKTVPRTDLNKGVEVMRIINSVQESLGQNGKRIDLR